MALQPLADRLAQWLRMRSVLHADETPVRQLDPAAWLRETLDKLPTCPNSQIDSLLPLRTQPLYDSSSQENADALGAYAKRAYLGSRRQSDCPLRQAAVANYQ